MVVIVIVVVIRVIVSGLPFEKAACCKEAHVWIVEVSVDGELQGVEAR